MKMVPASRQPEDVYLTHEHPTIVGFMKRRLGDGSTTTDHKVPWNYYLPRNRWEAVCEVLDVVFYAPVQLEDVQFRKDRTLC
jgi:hypothetical protein